MKYQHLRTTRWNSGWKYMDFGVVELITSFTLIITLWWDRLYWVELPAWCLRTEGRMEVVHTSRENGHHWWTNTYKLSLFCNFSGCSWSLRTTDWKVWWEYRDGGSKTINIKFLSYYIYSSLTVMACLVWIDVQSAIGSFCCTIFLVQWLRFNKLVMRFWVAHEWIGVGWRWSTVNTIVEILIYSWTG